MMGATECGRCQATGLADGVTCPDCDGGGWFDQDGEPCFPEVDALIAAAVMPVPELGEDRAWKAVQSAIRKQVK